MLRRLVALVVVCAVAWAPARALADEPQVASAPGSPRACQPADAACGSAADGGGAGVEAAGFVPSRPSKIAEGHGDQSAPVLVVLGLLSVAGLVVSVLHRLSLEES